MKIMATVLLQRNLRMLSISQHVAVGKSPAVPSSFGSSRTLLGPQHAFMKSRHYTFCNSQRMLQSEWVISASSGRKFSTASPPAGAAEAVNIESMLDSLQQMDKVKLRVLIDRDPDTWRKVETECRIASSDSEKEVSEPTSEQMKLHFLGNFLPFVGFGFFDNAIMLICGDFIDAKLGVAFGISTMCAAALGNIVGDVSGIWLGGTIEYLVGKNVQDHMMTSAQMRLHSVQTLKSVAMAVGIFTGCLLGMFPLAWPENLRLWENSSTETERPSSSGQDAR
eukprot:gnl/TRDRNA2_/TRDRNA2_89708_c0_seq1.p1 gnl/TRDRNA2_/TRDRNA2_89708_c0~~gnl/TRDRNA2_/TRDRNA2_89708_c0_seq1.p1  ORF type:complete len:280 (-),score=40.85 gnl/TRDRNA2_/TRDRNA2_89708_c0_seq1:104-943(-)